MELNKRFSDLKKGDLFHRAGHDYIKIGMFRARMAHVDCDYHIVLPFEWVLYVPRVLRHCKKTDEKRCPCLAFEA